MGRTLGISAAEGKHSPLTAAFGLSPSDAIEQTMSQDPDQKSPSSVTAAILVIGDEVLSGRTQDVHVSHIATELGQMGIAVKEARIIADDREAIVEAVNHCRTAYTYVLTTGGIGPTHDDITSESIAAAFGVPYEFHPDAKKLLEEYYKDQDFNEGRQRMAKMPRGALLIDNPVSVAPGFQIDNVFVMAGVPTIARAMLQSVLARLTGGAVLLSRSVSASATEGQIATPLGQIQDKFPSLMLGSYPYYRNKGFGISIVIRSTDDTQLEAAVRHVEDMFRALGQEPVRDEI